MNKPRWKWPLLALMGAVAAIGALYVKDWMSGVRTVKWTEEVRLEDGSTMNLKRMAKVRKAGSVYAAGPVYTDKEARIIFMGPHESLPDWRFPRRALVIYRDDATNEWAIVASSTSYDVIVKRGIPSIYWEYRTAGDSWKEVPLSNASAGKKLNLYTSYPSMTKRHISARETAQLAEDRAVYEAFRVIDPSAR
jgi:hypothetical protein